MLTINNNIFDRFITYSLIILMASVIIFPNSFKIYILPLFCLIGVMTFFKVKYTTNEFLVLSAGSFLTIIYLVLGMFNSNSVEQVPQLLFVYLISPLIWISISIFILNNYQIKTIFTYLQRYLLVAAITVPIFMLIFKLGGGDYLKWIIEENNVVFEENYSGATMHVFGSLIFGFAGVFSTNTISNNNFKSLVIILFISVALLSGRSALILSIAIGFLVLVINNLNKVDKILLYFLTIVLCFVGVYFVLNFLNIDLFGVLEHHYNKLIDGGGDERTSQFDALLQGSINNHFLGSGHGVGVDFIRSEEYPWRYENLPMATIFRTGLIGLLIYAIPIFFTTTKFIRIKKNINQIDIFIFTGFIAILIANFTNPYFESYAFQWMIFFPFIYFERRVLTYSKLKGKKQQKNKNG